MKRMLDIVVSAVVLLCGMPVFALVAIAVVLESGPPVFYAQWRVGRSMRLFRLYKFRSMRRGSTGPCVTVSGDVRITRVGRILRNSKLDELPQFWNVLLGDMSLVGPRPEIPAYVDLYRERYGRVLTLRPGITDLASIRYRHEERLLAGCADPLQDYARTILPAKLLLAEEYVRRRSLRLDAEILWRTLQAVLRSD
jgi:lipopolysaccharide/colanic/teichoic acid biosynthesis glycosyltransferase